MGFVEYFIRFPPVQTFGNRLRFDEVTDSLKLGTFCETQCSARDVLMPNLIWRIKETIYKEYLNDKNAMSTA